MSNAATTAIISGISIITVHVKDQDEALRFYTERLGFEKRTDADMGGGMRWVTVAPAGSSLEISLVSTYEAGAPMGGNTGIVVEVNDIDAAYRELSARGVRFTREPTGESFGGWAEFADQDGNCIGVHSTERRA